MKKLLFLLLFISTTVFADYSEFKRKLGQSESSGNYDILIQVNQRKFLGKYQFGYLALEDLGFIKNKRWTGAYGIYSDNAFLKSPRVQELAATKWFNIIVERLKQTKLISKIGKTIHGVKITLSGLIAASHLAGVNGTNKYLNGGRNRSDKFGTSIRDYLIKFKGIKIGS